MITQIWYDAVKLRCTALPREREGFSVFVTLAAWRGAIVAVVHATLGFRQEMEAVTAWRAGL
jgi:hypothetical protein